MKNKDLTSEEIPVASPVEPKEAQPNSVTTFDLTEINGPKGPEPTRYGDWERKGRCVDF
jgi:hypothetical protein